MGEFGRASKQPRACHCRMTVGPNENGPDVKLGSTRQGRTFRPAFGKAGRGQSRPKLMANSLRLTVNGSSICRTWRRKRAEDHLTSAPVRRLRCSEPRDGLDGFPRILARTIELNEPRVPIGELGFTEG